MAIITMDNHQPPVDWSDPARLEKELESDRSSRPASLHHVPNADSPPDGAHNNASDGRIFLSEEQVLNRARQYPDKEEPIYLAYAPHDRDNPRNWPNWKRWYITCFVSMLNVLTYEPPLPPPPPKAHCYREVPRSHWLKAIII